MTYLIAILIAILIIICIGVPHLGVIILGTLCLVLYRKYKTTRDSEEKAKELNNALQNQNRQLNEENELYRPIIDREQRAAEIIIEAINRKKQIIAEANEKKEKIESEERDILKKIYDHEETVGKLKNEIGALKRKTEGYGREYLIPGIGLLDELAVDFGHTGAGQQLKKARTNVRQMFTMKEAASCDYVEKNRQDTATDFVTDAFNGKVEEILSRVKHDNYGKLSQEIRDAAILVNKNGNAFRNAHINQKYIDARLEELKWATIVHELKKKEREEQKAINEQIREERKVQKEIEKAQKEADKAQREAEQVIAREQERYQKLLEKFAAMSEEEKAANAKERAELEAKHAEELAAAEERIRLAEEKRQRALSMAQQTKQGNVYIISNIGSFGENVYKIGMTRRLEPEDRVQELSGASVPFPFDIHGMIHFEDCPTAEKKLHRIFVMNQVNKTNFRKEFFRASLEDIKSAVEKLGGEAHWTMFAEAAQYRETLRIEERIKNDAAYRREWEERQGRLGESITFPWDEDEEEEE